MREFRITIYYADRKTIFYATIDGGLIDAVTQNKVSWVVGKKEQVEKFLEATSIKPRRSMLLNEEMIVNINTDAISSGSSL